MTAEHAVEKIENELKSGLVAPIDSEECKEHNRTHPNCVGCKHHDGCREFIARFGQYCEQVLVAEGEMTLEELEALGNWDDSS